MEENALNVISSTQPPVVPNEPDWESNELPNAMPAENPKKRKRRVTSDRPPKLARTSQHGSIDAAGPVKPPSLDESSGPVKNPSLDESAEPPEESSEHVDPIGESIAPLQQPPLDEGSFDQPSNPPEEMDASEDPSKETTEIGADPLSDKSLEPIAEDNAAAEPVSSSTDSHDESKDLVPPDTVSRTDETPKPIGNTNNVYRRTEYPKGSFKEIYCNPPTYAKDRHGHEYYARDMHGDEILLRDSSGDLRYAWYNDPNGLSYEMAPKDHLGREIYIKFPDGRVKLPYHHGFARHIFPKDPATGDDYYPTDPNTNEPFYPLDYMDAESYARLKDGTDAPLVKNDGTALYAKIGQHEFYPESNSTQYYIRAGNKDVFAKEPEDRTIYARNKLGDEIYPREYLEE